MKISEIIEQRNIQEVLHFTTNQGLLGILDTKLVKPRNNLNNDQRLEFILQMNTNRVLDPKWKDHVSCSISRINTEFFMYCRKWHQNLAWRILSFDPVILTHESVHFTTTNNIYPSVLRGKGASGLDALFALTVAGKYGKQIIRQKELACACPTCVQAEVLYPGGISTEFLRRIYVETGEDQDDVNCQIGAVADEDFEVKIKPGAFRGEI